MSVLYIVGTPIGNLGDMAPRAISVLKEVQLIAAEDTRHTRKLLNYFGIKTHMESYHKFSEKEKIPKLIELLKNGQDIALVSNAGMPGISDPGELLIRTAIENNINVVPVPGPSAFILALSASGLSTERFIFEGFLPRKKGERIKRLYSLKEETRTLIFYESGKRIEETIMDMQKIFGDRKCAIARELTKKFEEIKRGDLNNITYSTKGEFVIIVEGGAPRIACLPDRQAQINLKEEIQKLQKELGISAKDAIKLTAAKFNVPKREVYGEWHRD